MCVKLKINRYFSILFIFMLIVSLWIPMVEHVVQATEQTISVEEAIQKNNDGSIATVEGYIVGYAKSRQHVIREGFPDDYNFAMADQPGETNPNKMVLVQVTKDFRSEFGLKANPYILDEAVKVTGSLEKYHGGIGVKSPTDMQFLSDEPHDEESSELLTIEQARTQGEGIAKVRGVVTATLKNTIHIQDETAAIAVRPTSLDVQVGDEITVSGTLQQYRGLLQLDDATLEEKRDQVGVPNPLELTGKEISEKKNESKLAVVNDVTLTSVQQGSGWANFTATDGTEFIVRDETDTLGLAEGATYRSITGIVYPFDDEYQLIPRKTQDIVLDDSLVHPVVAIPRAGMIPAGTAVELTTPTDGATIYYTTDGTKPTVENGQPYSEPIVVTENTTIQAISKKDGFPPSSVKIFTYNVYDADGIAIHDIQGEGHESPLKGNVVNDVEGIVTFTYDLQGAHYFHMQLPEDQYDGNPKTSEGIVVYTGKSEHVNIGDRVRVTGKVDEYYIDGFDGREQTDLPVTQINARDDQGGNITIVEHNVELPKAIELTSSDIPAAVIGEDSFDTFDPENNAIDFWESMEGMRVEVAPSKAVAPQEHGELIVVTEEFATDTIHGGIRLKEEGPNAQFIQFKLYPNSSARDFAVKTGDQITEAITGVVNYGFSNYKVYAELDGVEEVFKEGNSEPQTTTIEKDADQLTVATYNVENFSANASSKETPPEKAKNIAHDFVHHLKSPDIVGVVEVQDNNGQDEGPMDADASKSYERLIRSIEEAGGPTYEYVNINPQYNQDGGAPHGNIRVGFLYRPERVTLTDGEHGTATRAVDYINGQLTLNPGRINPTHRALQETRKPLAAQFAFKGERVVIVANHWNSKRGDNPIFGQNQPPVLRSEPQRMEIAQFVNDFVRDVEVDYPDENIVVLGDMNDFEFSPPLKKLAGNELTNMIDHVPEDERYTYVYQGHSQVLDHLLVSNHLANSTEVDIVHLNADFTEMHGRSSDHEPVIAQLDLHKKSGEDASERDGREESNESDPPGQEEGRDEVKERDNENERAGSVEKKDQRRSEGRKETDEFDQKKGKDEMGAFVKSNEPASEVTAEGGERLPNTATPVYSLLLIGAFLIVFGSLMLVFKNKGY